MFAISGRDQRTQSDAEEAERVIGSLCKLLCFSSPHEQTGNDKARDAAEAQEDKTVPPLVSPSGPVGRSGCLNEDYPGVQYCVWNQGESQDVAARAEANRNGEYKLGEQC